MAALADLVVDLSVNTAALRSGLDEATGMVSKFGEKLAAIGEAAISLEAVKLGMEAIAKAGEFMEQGLKDAAALGNGPSRELLETFEHVGLATRQLGADLMSDLAPAFNSLISWFTDGADMGKILSTVAALIGQAFRMLVEPIVAVAGAIKGFAESGNLEGALNGAATATAKLAEHGKDFAGSLKTAAEQAAAIAQMQLVNTNINTGREANRMAAQFENLSGNRRQDRFAGVMDSFPSFNDALSAWKRNMQEAADLTAKAAVADAFVSKLQAEADRLQADQAMQAAEAAKQAADGWRAAKEKLIVDTAAINKIQLQLSESLTKISVDTSIKSQQYHGTYDPTAGFKDFDDALARQAAALDLQAQDVAAADIIQQTVGPSAQATVDALRAAAAKLGITVNAAGAAADAFFAVKDRLKQQLTSALDALGNGLLSNLGTLGKTVSDVIKGAQQGGIWGALAAAIVDLVSQIKGWTSIQNIADGQMKQLLQTMSSGLDSIIAGLKPLMGALGFLSNIVGTLLNPIFQIIGQVLQGIAPLFIILGEVLKPLSGTFNQISSVLSGVLGPVLKGLTYVFIGIGEVMLALQLAVDYVILGFNDFVNQIDSWGGGNNQGGIDAAQQTINDTLAQMDQLAHQTPEQLAALADASAAASEAVGAQANAANDSANAMSKFTQSLSNVPEGFKLALRTYQAIGAQGSGGVLGSVRPTSISIDKLQVVANSVTDLYNQLLTVHKRKGFQNGGG